MPSELINILIQLPIVAIFVWYSERLTTKFQDFLREERNVRVACNDRLVAELEKLTQALDHHDQKTDAAISRMEERTRPRSEKPGR